MVSKFILAVYEGDPCVILFLSSSMNSAIGRGVASRGRHAWEPRAVRRGGELEERRCCRVAVVLGSGPVGRSCARAPSGEEESRRSGAAAWPPRLEAGGRGGGAPASRREGRGARGEQSRRSGAAALGAAGGDPAAALGSRADEQGSSAIEQCRASRVCMSAERDQLGREKQVGIFGWPTDAGSGRGIYSATKNR